MLQFIHLSYIPILKFKLDYIKIVHSNILSNVSTFNYTYIVINSLSKSH